MKSSYLNLNGLKHHVLTWGSVKKPKIFFFHGWLDMAASYHFVAEQLKNDFHCIALDWRGFGHSQHSRNALGYFFFEYQADVHALLDHYSKDTPADVVAHSMGGNALALFAGAFPEKIRRFINIEGFGIDDMPASKGPKRVRDWIEKRKPHRFKTYPTYRPIAEKLMMNNPRLPSERALFLAKHLCKKTARGYQIAADPRHKWMQPQLHKLDIVYPFWENITAKTLLVQGEKTEMAIWLGKDIDLEKELQERLSHFKNAQRVIIPDCAHMVHHEKPDELAKVIWDFMR